MIAGFAIAGADAEETLTRKQTNIQYFDFFRFYMNDEFLTCIFVIERLFLQQEPWNEAANFRFSKVALLQITAVGITYACRTEATADHAGTSTGRPGTHPPAGGILRGLGSDDPLRP
ncbi:hypothetical protein [Rhizobium leguminosarum]|uniref:hypothetical protein n=1 Tax=Rhizobium leguminosarum TaxID=384 RepID=UPI0028F44ECB|nr:hypothetical protein [Rhizobium leguminosarum]